MAAPENITGAHVLSYMYLLFGHMTDGDLSEDEIITIKRLIKEWGVDDPDTVVKEAFDWICSFESKEDQIGQMIDNLPALKGNFGEKGCGVILKDIVQIAKSDGNYDDDEKKWASNIAKHLGIEDPNA